MPLYRICKSFVVESGHMLSKHPESCRFPHGHSRRIDIVITAPALDVNDMVCDFKALKMAVSDIVDQMDHVMAINSEDPFLPFLDTQLPGSVLAIEGRDPTTEVMAEEIFYAIQGILAQGFTSPDGLYIIPAGSVTLESVRVTETDSSWAEFMD